VASRKNYFEKLQGKLENEALFDVEGDQLLLNNHRDDY